MSYEINILVVNQESPVHLPFSCSIELRNEREDDGFGRYFAAWPFFSCIKGILYSLVKDAETDHLCAFTLCEVNFDAPSSENHPEWISEQYAQDNLYPLIIKPEFFCDFVRVIEFLLEKSPDGFIMFQTRYQGGDSDIIFGTISSSQFFLW